MRKTLFSLVVALTFAACAALGFAQTANTPFSSPWYFASSFNLWSINGQSPNTYIFQGRSVCNGQGQNVQFFDFSTTGPVLIADANSANSEVKTPSAIVNTAGSCGVTIAPSNNHYNFTLKSGTAGLQEAINSLQGQGAWPKLVILDINWWSNANQIPGTTAATILGAATGNDSVLIEDVTTFAPTYYVVGTGGTTYIAGTWLNTAPTAATGAAAGTASSKVATGTALSGTYSFTTGTATTGTVFTETWATSNQFLYAPACTVTSTGATAPPTLTVTPTYASSTHGLLTVTVASALANTTAYSFSWNCK